jgi:tetratricopeptide (TPR) repeat protein
MNYRSFAQGVLSSYEPRYKLAELYLQGGFGVDQDFCKAVKWLEKAIAWPNISWDKKHRAQFKLGQCYLTGGPGLEQSYAKAIEHWEEISAPTSYGDQFSLGEKCSRQAQRQLGICHALGKGVQVDFSRAKEYFEKAARFISDINNASHIPTVVEPCAEAELGVCLYQLGKIEEARECFERSAKKDDILGNLWLCCLLSKENENLRGKIEYRQCYFERLGFNRKRILNELTENDIQNHKIDKTETEIDKRLRDVAVRFEELVRERGSLELDMLDASNLVIEFLQNRPCNRVTYPAQIILAFYHKLNTGHFLACLEKASSSCNDVIANYWLGKYFANGDPEKAVTFYKKVIEKNHDSDSYSSEEKYVNLSTQDLKNIELARVNKKLQQSNMEVTTVNTKMQKFIAEFTHTLRNVIFPDTIYQVTERLKNKPECRKDVLLLNDAYHSEIIIKLQAELLQNRYASTNPERLCQVIRVCRRSPDSGDKIKLIADILDYAASRVAARFLNQHNASLNSIRSQILSWNQISLDALKQKFEDDILLNRSLSAIKWIDQNLRPLKVIGISPLWQKVRILAESHAEALLFGYFSEVLFNAFKYADHSADEFLVVDFDECIIDGKTYLTVSFRNPLGNIALIELGTGEGLDAIKEDLRQLNGTSNDTNSLLVTQNGQTFQVTLFFQKDLLLDEVPMPKFKRKITVE